MIPGVWAYKSPAVQFKSETAIASAARGVVGKTAENALGPYYEKVGINEGNFFFEFLEDGKVKIHCGNSTFGGSWKYDNENSRLKMTFAMVISLTAFVEVKGKKMEMLFDATTLMKILRIVTANSSDSTTAAIGAVLKSYDDMYAGFNLAKSKAHFTNSE